MSKGIERFTQLRHKLSYDFFLKCASIRSHAFSNLDVLLQKQIRTRCFGGSSLTYNALT